MAARMDLVTDAIQNELDGRRAACNAE